MSAARTRLHVGLAALVAAVAVCLVAPAAALAHAQLEGTTPQRGGMEIVVACDAMKAKAGLKGVRLPKIAKPGEKPPS